jgi:hypothetical protein
MIAWIIFFAIILSVLHFVFEAILSPGYLEIIRFRQFEIRDKLRLLKHKYPEELSDEMFAYLEDSINANITHSKEFTLSFYFRMRKAMQGNEKLSLKARKIIDDVQRHSLKEVQDLFDATVRNVFFTFLINSGGWSVFIIVISPVLIVVALGYILTAMVSNVMDGVNPKSNFQNITLFADEEFESQNNMTIGLERV